VAQAKGPAQVKEVEADPPLHLITQDLLTCESLDQNLHLGKGSEELGPVLLRGAVYDSQEVRTAQRAAVAGFTHRGPSCNGVLTSCTRNVF
jgi:hypothetical protein